MPSARTTPSAPEPIRKLRAERSWPGNVPLPTAGAYSSRKSWSPEDVATLRKEYPEHGGKYVARMLGRSFDAVKIRASRMGIERRPIWSEEELAFLKEHYGTMSKREIATELDRSLVSVGQQATKHGLTAELPERWSRREFVLLRKHYGTMPNADLASLLDRPQKGMVTMASKLGLGAKRREIAPETVAYVVEHASERGFLGVARELDLPVDAVIRIAKRHGIHTVGRPNRWRPEEDAYVRKHYHDTPIPDIARHLGRTSGALHQRLKVLGLSFEEGRYAREVGWSHEEEAMLRELFPLHSRREVAARLGRTPQSIKRKAAKLGLRHK